MTSAYYGSFFKMRSAAERRFKEGWERLEPHLPGVLDIRDNFGIGNLFLAGRRANGANHLLGEPYEFLIDERNHVVPAAKVILKLTGCIGDVVGVGFAVHHAGCTADMSPRIHLGPGRQDERPPWASRGDWTA